MTKLFGGLFLGIGILVMTCSGLCSLAVVVLGFSSFLQEPSVIMLPLIVGGIPFALGFGAFKLGQWMLSLPDDRDGAALPRDDSDR
jgi:hypothetical protein